MVPLLQLMILLAEETLKSLGLVLKTAQYHASPLEVPSQLCCPKSPPCASFTPSSLISGRGKCWAFLFSHLSYPLLKFSYQLFLCFPFLECYGTRMMDYRVFHTAFLHSEICIYVSSTSFFVLVGRTAFHLMGTPHLNSCI